MSRKNEVALTVDQAIAPAIPQMVEMSDEKLAKRIAATFAIAAKQEPKILQCTPESIQMEVVKCSADGLVPDSKEAVLLPYYDKDAKAMVLNYQPMVRGVIKRMRELGEVFSITCEVVCENDTFHANTADPTDTKHEWDIMKKDRGEVVGAYAIFRDKEGRILHREIMGRKDIDNARQHSKASNSPAWRNWFAEMARKSVLHRGAKYITISNEAVRDMIERLESMYDFKRQPEVDRENPFTGETIEYDSSTGEIEDTAASTSAADQGEAQDGDVPLQTNNPDASPTQMSEEDKNKLLRLYFKALLKPIDNRGNMSWPSTADAINAASNEFNDRLKAAGGEVLKRAQQIYEYTFKHVEHLKGEEKEYSREAIAKFFAEMLNCHSSTFMP